MEPMRGLVVDFCGVLDGTEEDRRRWRKLLKAVREAEIPVAILSNNPGGAEAAPVRAWLEQGHVDAVVLSGEVGIEKPDPRIFAIVAERLDLPQRELVFVDDSILNIRSAVDAGLVGVFYQQFERSVVEIQGLFNLDGEF